MSSTKRPVFLNPLQIKLPLPGVVSITHRITGVLLFLSIPLSIYLLGISTESATGFAAAGAFIRHPLVMVIVLLIQFSFLFHFFAGIRYLILDAGYCEDLPSARRLAWYVIVLSVVSFVLLALFTLCWFYGVLL